jgi:circadian clock protein KaiC
VVVTESPVRAHGGTATLAIWRSQAAPQALLGGTTLSPQPAPVPLVQLPTGVPGLDEVLGGGIPEYSCTVIAGGPGSGRTTLAQQILFANSSSGRPGVYFTGLGERPGKLVRHQQQLMFFDPERLNRSVHVVSLGQRSGQDDTRRVLDTIACELEDRRPSFVVVDLVRALASVGLWNELALFLADYEATTFLIADSEPLERASDVAFSTADAILVLRQSLDGRATVRTIQVVKVRGQQPLSGLHSLSLTWRGMQVFPRWPTPQPRVSRIRPLERLAVGTRELDHMLAGGLPAGDSLLVEGPSGCGKSVMATQFIAEGAHQGQPGAAFLFEERPDRFIARAEALGLGLERLIKAGQVEVLSFRGRDLSADELIAEVQRAVAQSRAQRVVLDSAASLELVLTGTAGLRDCLWRLLDALTGTGVTVWLNSTPNVLAPSLMSLVDDVLLLRRTEREGWVENLLTVIKMRSSTHSTDARAYEIGEHGMQLGARQDNGSDGSNIEHMLGGYLSVAVGSSG